MLSELTRSISPAADNVQHYITGIKYSEAQYNQVNVCTYTHASTRRRHCTLLLKTIPAKLIQITKSGMTANFLKSTEFEKHVLILLQIREPWTQTQGGNYKCNLSQPSSSSFARSLFPADNEVIYSGRCTVCSINETFSVAAMTKIFKWPPANMKKQFLKPY